MGSKPIIVLADDDEDDRHFFKMAVESTGLSCSVILLKDGTEFKDYLGAATEKPVIVFLDINMPRIDGFECLELVRTKYNPNEVAVVMYTTSNSQADRQQAMELGANEYLVKPTGFSELKEIIARLVEKYRLAI